MKKKIVAELLQKITLQKESAFFFTCHSLQMQKYEFRIGAKKKKKKKKTFFLLKRMNERLHKAA